MQVGFYGKLPSHGDFLRRRVSELLQQIYKIPPERANNDVGQMSDEQVYAAFSRLKPLEEIYA